MAAHEAGVLLKKAWRERWTVEIWTHQVSKKMGSIEVKHLKDFRKSLTEGLIQYAVTSSSQDSMYKSYVKDGLITEQFSTAEIVDYICKDEGCNVKQCEILLQILEDSLTCLSKTHKEEESMTLAVSLAKCVCWLLGTISRMITTAYNISKQEIANSNVQGNFDISGKCFELVSRLLDTPGLQDLVLIGKIEVQDEQEMTLMKKLNDSMSLQPESLTNPSVSLQFQNNLKELMNVVAKFLNSTLTGVMSQNRKPGHVPSHSLQTLAELQVIENLFMDSSVMADLFDSVLRSENIPLDQFYVDLIRCGYHGILVAANPQEELLWASFVFLKEMISEIQGISDKKYWVAQEKVDEFDEPLRKIPSIVNYLRFKYQQSGLDNTVFFTACKQFAQLNILLDDLDVYCKFHCLPNFLSQCQNKGLLDVGQVEAIIGCRIHTPDLFEPSVTSERNPVGSVLNAVRTVTDILQIVSSPWEENKDIVRQQLTQLTNSNDLGVILATAAGMDKLSDWVEHLVRLNESTKGPVSEPNEDPVFAETRADLFNVTFVLLSYITAVFGIKVLSNVMNKEVFFVTWRMNRSGDVGQKRYSPMALDMILDQVMASNLPSINAVLAKWDDYCLCSGAVIKELTQALACGVIVVDKIQKVCETFKNKRPALCICASSWLCTQYSSMVASKRDMTIKILRAFRGHGAQKTARSEFMAKVIEDLAGSIVLEQPSVGKGKSVGKADVPSRMCNENQTMPEVLRKMVKLPGSPKIDKKSLNELRKHLKLLSSAGFSKVFVKMILDSGKIDEAKAFEVLSSTIMLIDPLNLVSALLSDAVPSIVHRSDAHFLLADPQGSTLAKFISRSLAYALIHAQAKASSDGQRSQKMAKFELSSDSQCKNRETLIADLAVLFNELLNALRWQKIGPIAVFVLSLLEQLCISTMHLTPPLRLPHDLAEMLLKNLSGKLSSDLLLFLFNTDDFNSRKRFAHRICKNLELTAD